MIRIVNVYLQDKLVGKLEQTDSADLSFTYDADYLNTAEYGISLSLPLKTKTFKGKQVKAFFSGLLPEENVRENLARHLGLSKKNSFALLEALGGDCAGALALYPQGQKPSKKLNNVETLSNERLQEILALIKRRPMLVGDEGYRLSLAGAQDKLAVGFKDGHILLIKDGAPTTHILKPVIEGVKDSAHNEFFCMKLAQMVGIDVAQASLHFAGDTPYYLAGRYDRHIAKDGTITRIHQEDFCQALGIAPEVKYEREGGASIAECQNLITKHSSHPALDHIKLLNVILFNYLIGNADAHGKNFSLLYKGNKPQLAPAYDLLSTAIYSDFSQKMAMKIGGKYEPNYLCLRNFYKLVADTKIAKSALDKQIKKITSQTIKAAPTLKEKLNKVGILSDVFDEIIVIIKERSKRLN